MQFNCVDCNALYHLIKVEAGPETIDRDLNCQACGAPLLAAADHVCQGGLSCVAGHVVKAISQLRFLTQRKPPVRFLAAGPTPTNTGRARARTKRAFKFAEANKELFELLLVHS